MGSHTTGQICWLNTRVLAPRSRYNEIVDTITDMARSLKLGDPLDPETKVGPLFAALGELPKRIPGILHFSGGPYASPEGLNQGFTHGFLFTFEGAKARDAEAIRAGAGLRGPPRCRPGGSWKRSGSCPAEVRDRSPSPLLLLSRYGTDRAD